MNKKVKLSIGMLWLLALPPAMLELLNNVYNNYVPIFMQAGSETFAAKGSTLTLGFGLGALLVGFWMTADNLFGFFAQPIVGAWSDRTRSKRGRRIPFILATLPFIIIGYALIPVIPRLIPPELSGQAKELTGLFVAFTLSCIVYYLGFTPVRVVLQALRQESVENKDRIKVESWYNFILNVFTIIAYTLGASLYRLYGPLLFWVILALYVMSVVVLVLKYKEPEKLAEAPQEESNFKQLLSVFKDSPKEMRKNLLWFLLSVTFFTLGASAYTNFCSSWAVNMLGVDEASASQILAIIIVASTIVVLPAGYIASSKFGRRNMYLVGLLVMISSAVFLIVLPKLYMVGFILLGAGAGIGFPSQLPLATELTPNQQKLGSVIGVYNLFYLTGFVTGSYLVGWLIEKTSYASLFPALLVFIALSLACFLFVKDPKAADIEAA